MINLKTALIPVILSILLSACVGGVGTRALPVPKEGKISAFEPKQIEQVYLRNGLRVLLAVDDELPLISGGVIFKGGSIWAKPNELATYGALASQLREGGTKSRAPHKLDLELERLSARISSDVSRESASLKFSCLSSDFSRVLPIFSDVLLNPRFDVSELELWKHKVLEGIQRRKDDSDVMAQIALDELLFGGSIYGYTQVSSDIKAVSRASLKAAYSELFDFSRATIVINGRFKRQELLESLETYFGGLRIDVGAQRKYKVAPEFSPKVAEPALYFLPADFQQSVVVIAKPGPKRHQGDVFSIELFNQIFGAGSLSTRLMKEVRTKRGLAYSTYGGIFADSVLGKNLIYLRTKRDTTAAAIFAAAETLRQMQTELVEVDELEETKVGIAKSFIFDFDSAAKVVNRKIAQEFLGYPEDYDASYVKNINAVTPERVRQVAEAEWSFDDLIIIVVGNQEILPQLQELVVSDKTPFRNYNIRQLGFDEKLVW